MDFMGNFLRSSMHPMRRQWTSRSLLFLLLRQAQWLLPLFWSRATCRGGALVELVSFIYNQAFIRISYPMVRFLWLKEIPLFNASASSLTRRLNGRSTILNNLKTPRSTGSALARRVLELARSWWALSAPLLGATCASLCCTR